MCTGWGRSLLDTYLDKTSLAVEGNIHHLRTPKNTQEKAIQRATLLPFRPYGVKNLKNLCKFAESVAKPREARTQKYPVAINGYYAVPQRPSPVP